FVHAGAADRNAVDRNRFAGNLVTAGDRLPAVQEGEAGVVPIRLSDQLTIFGFDILLPNLQRVVDMSVAVKDREVFAQLCVCHRCTSALRVGGFLPAIHHCGFCSNTFRKGSTTIEYPAGQMVVESGSSRTAGPLRRSAFCSLRRSYTLQSTNSRSSPK